MYDRAAPAQFGPFEIAIKPQSLDNLRPTKQLTKSGVLRKRETSSLARSDHFWKL
jgi:hypothetical protein